ncbi:MAG: thioredoxin family protein [Bacilli bacterium]|nr:thioredoxin family protein [Bacilli bacterium]MDD4808711.1 thioredoxin family protein [Bacilli bacterium]
MKKKKNNTIWYIIVFIGLIGSFFVLTSVNNQKSLEQVLQQTFSGNESKLLYLSRVDCPWCQKQKPLLSKVGKEYGFKYDEIKVDGFTKEELNSLLQKLEIDEKEFGTPTLVVIQNQKVVDSHIGYLSESALVNFLEETNSIEE